MFPIKNLKVAILVLLLLISVFFIFSPFLFRKSGVVVSLIDPNSTCSNVNLESSITQVGGVTIRSEEDFKNAVSRIKADEYVAMVVNGGPADCKTLGDGNIGVTVRNVVSSPIKFGTDLVGGTIFTFKPEKEVAAEDFNKILTILNKRVKFFNYQDTKVYQEGSNVKIKSFSDVDLSKLTMKGELKTRILEEIKFENRTGKIRIGSDSFPIYFSENKLTINNSTYGAKENFQLKNITFNLLNYTNNSAFVTAEIYSNEDVVKDYSQTAVVSKNQYSSYYQFNLQVQLSSKGSERFSQITKGMSASSSIGGQGALDGKLVFYLDDEIISSLDIPIEFIGKDIPVIVGFGKTQAEASAQLKKTESSLQFGKLPEKLILVGSSHFDPSMDRNDLVLLSLTSVIPVLIALGLSAMRYKKIKVGLYLVVLAAAEIVSTFGFILFFQRYSAYSLAINFSVLIGILVLFFSTVIKFLIQIENSFRKTSLTIHYKYKKLISLQNLINVILITISVMSFFVGWSGLGSTVIIGLFLEFVFIKPVYNYSLKKSFG